MASPSSSVQELVPPINFSLVCPGVYRSGYPTRKNQPFLRALRLRSIAYLCPEEYAESNLKFCEENSISLLRFPTEGNKEPFTDISEPLMHRILSALADTRNHPVLVHCNKGKHRTGTVCACLRLLQSWSLVSIYREYKAFSGSKARVSDQTYIELYYPIVKISPPFVAPWLTLTPRVKIVFSDRELAEEEAAQMGRSLLAPEPDKQIKQLQAFLQQQQQQQQPTSSSPTGGSNALLAPSSPSSVVGMMASAATIAGGTSGGNNAAEASAAAAMPSGLAVPANSPSTASPSLQAQTAPGSASLAPAAGATPSTANGGGAAAAAAATASSSGAGSRPGSSAGAAQRNKPRGVSPLSTGAATPSGAAFSPAAAAAATTSGKVSSPAGDGAERRKTAPDTASAPPKPSKRP